MILHTEMAKQEMFCVSQQVSIIRCKQNIINTQYQKDTTALTNLHMYTLINNIFFIAITGDDLIKL